MPTEDRVIDVPLHGGMSESADDFLAGQPFVADAYNAFVEKDGSYTRAASVVSYTNDGLPPIPEGCETHQMISHVGNAPQVWTVDGVYSYSQNFTKWNRSIPNGLESIPCTATSRQANTLDVGETRGISRFDYAVTPAGFEFFVYFCDPAGSGTNAWYYSIRDPRKQWVVRHKKLVGDSATQSRVRLTTYGEYVVVVFAYSSPAEVFIRRFNMAATSVTAMTTPATLSLSINTSVFGSVGAMDVCRGNDTVMIAAVTGVSGPPVTHFVHAFRYNVVANTASYAISTSQTNLYTGSTAPLMVACCRHVDWSSTSRLVIICALKKRLMSFSIKEDPSAWSGSPGDITYGTFWDTSNDEDVLNVGVCQHTDTLVAAAYTVRSTKLWSGSYLFDNVLNGRTFVEIANVMLNTSTNSFDFAFPKQTRAYASGYWLSHKPAYLGKDAPPIFGLCYNPWRHEFKHNSYGNSISGLLSIDEMLNMPDRPVSGQPDWFYLFVTIPKTGGTQTGLRRVVPIAKTDVDRALTEDCIATYTFGDGVLRTGSKLITEFLPNLTPISNSFGSIEIHLNPKHSLSAVELSDGRVLAPGVVANYDGGLAVENTPVAPPTVLMVPKSSSVSKPLRPGTPANGVTRFAFVWQWTDGTNREHRSAPSFVSVDGNTLSCSLVVEVPVTAVDQHWVEVSESDDFRHFKLEVYRSQIGGGHPYELYSTFTFEEPAVLNPHTYHVREVYFSVANKNDLSRYKKLYTAGGVLPAWSPPTMNKLTATKDRVWGTSADNPDKVYYSKTFETGIAPEFAAELYVSTPPSFGEVVAVEAMDDKVIIFCELGVCAVLGSGPNNTGLGGDFEVIPLQTDYGCISPGSVVSTRLGIFYQGPRGIYLLDRALSTNLVSAGVQKRLEGRIVESAFFDPDRERVFFAIKEGNPETLVYHYRHNVWTRVLRGRQQSVARGVDGRRVFLSNAYIFREDPAANSGTSDGMILRSNWIKLSNIQGFFRVKRVQLLGRKQPSEHTGDFVVEFAHNYVNQNKQTVTFPWSSAYVSVADNRWQIETHVKKQKCESIRITFRDQPVWLGGDGGGGTIGAKPVSLSAVTLLVGVLPPPEKQFKQMPSKMKR